jgi:hypothetical protein
MPGKMIEESELHHRVGEEMGIDLAEGDDSYLSCLDNAAACPKPRQGAGMTQRTSATPSDRHFARIMAEDWWRLSGQEQAEAITHATLAGPLVAMAWFGDVTEGECAGSLGGLIAPGVNQFEDGSLLPGAKEHGLPNPPFYIQYVIGTACPDRLEEWRSRWKEAPEAVSEDPRFYHFSDAFERERCRLKGEEEPPRDAVSLLALECAEHEEERQLARDLFDRVFRDEPADHEELEELREVYLIQRSRVDQIAMLLAAAENGSQDDDERL